MDKLVIFIHPIQLIHGWMDGWMDGYWMDERANRCRVGHLSCPQNLSGQYASTEHTYIVPVHAPQPMEAQYDGSALVSHRDAGMSDW